MGTFIGIGIGLGMNRSSSSNWTPPLSLVVEDATPTYIDITFPSAKTVLAGDFTIAGFTVNSGSWSGSVYTLVLSVAVVYGDVLSVVYKGKSYAVTNNVWGPLLITSKFLEGWKITGSGNLVGLVLGDTLIVGGSAGSYTFQVPNTSAYQNADSDNIWFRADVSQRIPTQNELASYDFSKTFVKYLNVYPYIIQEIWLLKSGQTLTTAELNHMRTYCQLSIWWDNTLSIYGAWKANRGTGQSVWPGETLIIPTILTATIENAAKANVVLTFNHTLNPAAPATTVFALAGKTISNVSILGAVVTITVSVAYTGSDVVTIDYTQPTLYPLQELVTEGQVVSFAGHSVTNNIGGYDADISAFFTRALAADGVDQTLARKSNYNTMTLALKGNNSGSVNFWDKSDRLIIYQAKGDGTRMLNLIKNANNAEGVANGGTLTQIDDVGVHGDGTKSYIRSHYNPSTDGSKFAKDDCSIFYLFSGGPLTEATFIANGGWDGTQGVDIGKSGGAAYNRLNGSTSGGSTFVIGHNCVSRHLSTEFDTFTHLIPAGTEVNANSAAKNSLALPNSELYSLGANWAGTPSYFVNNSVYLAIEWQGSHITFAQFQVLVEIFKAYILAL